VGTDLDANNVFWDVMGGLPRQGVGSDVVTAEALARCVELPPKPDILDIGCGPGRQSLVLARATGGHVTAVDLHAGFLDELRDHAAAAGLDDRITLLRADMRDLPLQPATFDLIWSEGAAYAMGVTAALVAWRRLLRPGGHLGYSDLVWTEADRPPRRGCVLRHRLHRHDGRGGQPGAHR
jgi:cyclopropane fatty-acyl-phospholipid synthase-like methyltransferase